jgi:hypothetical protein
MNVIVWIIVLKKVNSIIGLIGDPHAVQFAWLVELHAAAGGAVLAVEEESNKSLRLPASPSPRVTASW